MKRDITQVLTLIERASSERVKRSPAPVNRTVRLTKAQNDRIAELYGAGMRAIDIAKELGVTEWTVHHRLNRAGTLRRPTLTNEQLERAIELRGLGWSYDKIAKEVGSSYGTVRNRLGPL